MQTRKFTEVYLDEPVSSWSATVDGGPMSLSHWGMHDLGRFGVMIMGDEAHWQEGGIIFEVKEWLE